MYFTVTEDLEGRSFVYTLPLVPNPTAADLQVFHEYTGGDLPDGIAFGRSGLLYVAIATPFASGVSILSPNGTEVARLANQGNPMFPYDSPANIVFNGRGSILLNQPRVRHRRHQPRAVHHPRRLRERHRPAAGATPHLLTGSGRAAGL